MSVVNQSIKTTLENDLQLSLEKDINTHFISLSITETIATCEIAETEETIATDKTEETKHKTKETNPTHKTKETHKTYQTIAIKENNQTIATHETIAIKETNEIIETKKTTATNSTPSLPVIPIESSTLSSFAKYIQQNNIKNIIIMTGAGISTPSGIPDFRSPTGIYRNISSYALPYPEALFDIHYFKHTPEPFYHFAKMLLPGTYLPTLSHHFIKLLTKKNALLRCYTQNIDMLERRVGVDEKYLVEAHGTFHTYTCVGERVSEEDDSSSEECEEKERYIRSTRIVKGCGATYKEDVYLNDVLKGTVPECQTCGGLVKPDIVFFGEALPERFHTLVQEDFEKCEALIVIGTSLMVHPFAGLIDLVGSSIPRLFINREKRGESLYDKHTGFDFDWKVQKRDVLFLGDCDSGCLELAELLGIKQELLDMYNNDTRK